MEQFRPGGDRYGGIDLHHILTLVLGLLMLHGSTQFWMSYTANADLSSPIEYAGHFTW